MNSYYYSVFSGLIYETSAEMYSLLDEGQLPLQSKPKNCKHCLNRGYSGFVSSSYTYPPCKCVIKVVDNNRIKTKFNIS